LYRCLIVLAGSLALFNCSGGGSGSTVPVTPAGPAQAASRPLAFALSNTAFLPAALPRTLKTPQCRARAGGDQAVCMASVVTYAPATATVDSVYGLTPNDLATLYSYPAPSVQGSLGSQATLGIVVAYDHPNLESDLAVYRSRFGLPPCTVANGCLVIVGAAAGTASQGLSPSSITAFPTTGSADWQIEADIDTQAASAVCPNCTLVVSEAASPTLSDLANAVAAAQNAGANILSYSFGVAESSADLSYEAAFEGGRNAIAFAAAGDSGYGVNFPASATYVAAVGGTTVSGVVNSSVAETAWSGTSSGCSRVFRKHPNQHDPGCNRRTMNDIAAVADPNTGLAVYDAAVNDSNDGWIIAGGTSLSTPLVAAMFALSGDTQLGKGAARFYSHTSNFYNVTQGSNGYCYIRYLCTAQAGYNGPTGVGTPNGLAGL
jgi:subtilase family serine protease